MRLFLGLIRLDPRLSTATYGQTLAHIEREIGYKKGNTLPDTSTPSLFKRANGRSLFNAILTIAVAFYPATPAWA
jgi:hypothetical protein